MKAIKRDMRIFFPDTLELEKACSYVDNLLVLTFVEVPTQGPYNVDLLSLTGM